MSFLKKLKEEKDEKCPLNSVSYGPLKSVRFTANSIIVNKQKIARQEFISLGLSLQENFNLWLVKR